MQRRVFSTWERDFGVRAILQPLEVDDTPHGPPLVGLMEPPADGTLRVLVSQEVPTRFLRVETDCDEGPNHFYLVEVKSCVRVAHWGHLITTTILQTRPDAGPNPSA
ncbi:MAG: hypothetical protein GXP27_09470 [Planctomycetes bacterium]|nr:hypothetical protein [Planctomycetota bacterium]